MENIEKYDKLIEKVKAEIAILKQERKRLHNAKRQAKFRNKLKK